MPLLLKEDMERELPKMYEVRQIFARERLEDVGGAVLDELKKPEIRNAIARGEKIAVAVGSRGIRNLPVIVGAVVDGLKAAGAEPFIVSAMGSHGGGSEEGQRDVLYGYGVTPEAMGAPVVTSVDSLLIGRTENGVPIYFDAAALSADGIVPVNRVKLHTDFAGPIQSGLCKMLTVGLGNQRGCSAIHEVASEDMSFTIESAARAIIETAPLRFGVAVLENAYDETAAVEAIAAEKIISREKELLEIAAKNMPYIMLPEADVIVCENIGKDISGAGFDPNILGRSSVLKTFVLPIPRYQRLVLLGVTPASHGNGIGIGLFDVVTKKAVSALDLESMYANAIACRCIGDASIPCTAEDEETAVRVALKCCRGIDRDHPKIIKIKDTLHLETIEVSEALLDEVKANPKMQITQQKGGRSCS